MRLFEVCVNNPTTTLQEEIKRNSATIMQKNHEKSRRKVPIYFMIRLKNKYLNFGTPFTHT